MDASQAAAEFPIGNAKGITALSSGIVHASYLVSAEKGKYVLQRMNKIFEPSILLDMRDVTEHLMSKSIETFSLIQTSDGGFSYFDGAHHWRMLTHIEGAPLSREATEAELVSAGKLVGRFHTALLDYDKPIRHHIRGFHDTAAYLAHLKEVDEREAGSEKHATLHLITEDILEQAKDLPAMGALPLRILHGDLKIDNVLFDGAGNAVAIVDLDTVGRYRITTEVGDMLRSWTAEGTIASGMLTFSPKRYRAALTGYRETSTFVTDDEWKAIPAGITLISLELSARFAADAYEETYFAHDATRYPTLYDQNLTNARAFMAFLRDFKSKRAELA